MLSPTSESATKVRALIRAYRDNDDTRANVLLNDMIETNEDAAILLETLASHNANPVRSLIEEQGYVPGVATRTGRELRSEDPQSVAFMLTVFQAERRVEDSLLLAVYATSEPLGSTEHEFFYDVLNVLLRMATTQDWIRIAMPIESGQN